MQDRKFFFHFKIELLFQSRRAIDTFEIFDEVCDLVFEMSRHEFPDRCLTDTTVINREQL